MSCDGVSLSRRQKITDWVGNFFFLTIWVADLPFWLKHWLWCMGSGKTLQLSESYTETIIKKNILKHPHLPPMLARVNCAGWPRPGTSESWDIIAWELHSLFLHNSREDNRTENQRKHVYKAFRIKNSGSPKWPHQSCLWSISMGARCNMGDN